MLTFFKRMSSGTKIHCAHLCDEGHERMEQFQWHLVQDGHATQKGFTHFTAPVILKLSDLRHVPPKGTARPFAKSLPVNPDFVRLPCLLSMSTMSWKSEQINGTLYASCPATLPLHYWDFHLSWSAQNLSAKPKCSCNRVLEASTWPTGVEMPQKSQND